MSTAVSLPVQPRVLVGRGLDGLLVGWLAVIVWIAVFVADRLGVDATFPGLTAVYWTGAVVTAAHFGLSYHLAYRGGAAAVRERPVALLIGPAVLLGLLGLLTLATFAAGGRWTADATGALITTVYLLTTWHYVKQVYGVGRVGALYAGVKLGAREVQLMRYGLYPLWFLGAAQVLVPGGGSSLAGYRFGFEILPSWSFTLLRVLAVCAALPVGFVLAAITVRRRRVPSILTAPYVAAFLWLALPTDIVLSLLLLAPFHALQYLAIGHRAEMSLAAGRAGGHSLTWWLNIFAGAACGGLLLSRWVPQYLDAHLRGGAGPLLFSAAFFVFLNLHHYLIDASIWRSKGALIKALARPTATPVDHLRVPTSV